MCKTCRVEVTARNWRVFRKGFWSAHYRGPHLARERYAASPISMVSSFPRHFRAEVS